jgi:hypothetical protein
MFSLAQIKFITGLWWMFGGLPATVLSILYSLRNRITKYQFIGILIAYAFRYRYDAGRQFGRDSNYMRSFFYNLFAPLYKENGGRVIYPNPMFDTSKTYLIAGSPHGVVPFYWLIPLHQMKFGKNPPKPPIALGARVIFILPGVREVYLNWAIEGSQENFTALIEAGRSAVVIPGGVPEMVLSEPGNRVKIYAKNKGFVRLAISHGISIVPIFAFGEHNAWKQKRAPKWIADRITRFTGGTYPFINWGSWGNLLPIPTPVVHVIGQPVEMPHITEPSEDIIVHHHHRFYASLRNLILEKREEAGFATLGVEFVGLEELNIDIPPFFSPSENNGLPNIKNDKQQQSLLPLSSSKL